MDKQVHCFRPHFSDLQRKFRNVCGMVPKMYPFECSRCKKLTHAVSQSKCVCCDGATFEPLINICLLVIKKELDDQPIVHTSGHYQLPTIVGAEWGVACGAKKLPKTTTRYVPAVTCKKCLDWYNAKVEAIREAELDYQEK